MGICFGKLSGAPHTHSRKAVAQQPDSPSFGPTGEIAADEREADKSQPEIESESPAFEASEAADPSQTPSLKMENILQDMPEAKKDDKGGHGFHSQGQELSPGSMCITCSMLRDCRPTPPLGAKGSEDISHKKKGYVGRLLSLVSGFKPGGDLRSLQVPPQFNLPKSQLQLYGESLYCCSQDLLGACADAPQPLDRLLAVVRWHLSTARQGPFGKAPYNPVLGETHHVTAGDLNVLLEQVSHHPPVSALYATNQTKQIRMTWWHQPVPRFYGAWMEVDIPGRRVLHLDAVGESYEMDSPRLCLQLLPFLSSSWVGTTRVSCPETGYEAKVTFKGISCLGFRGSGPNAVEGTITDLRSGKVLFSLSGRWDKVVYVADPETGKSQVLYDSGPAQAGIAAPVVEDPTRIPKLESVLVWSKLTNCLVGEDWEGARLAKGAVEEEQRRLRKERSIQEVQWTPTFFMLKEGEWIWRDSSKAVPRAPIVVERPVPLPA